MLACFVLHLRAQHATERRWRSPQMIGQTRVGDSPISGAANGPELGAR
jgi:hypothetical protein